MRIDSVPKDITWKDFLKKYRKFFRISYEPKLREAMAKEYSRLTGRPAEDEKPKRKYERRKTYGDTDNSGL